MLLCAQPKAQYLAHKAEINEAVMRVLDSGWYILGAEVRAFEEAFAAFCGTRQGIGVGSGTEALHLALRAVGVGDGDEVITVSHTATASVAAIELTGARPVLVDIDPVHYTLDPATLDTTITEKTRAIVPVHLYGQPADMEPIMAIAKRHGLWVIEDCAQAHGARYRGQRVGSIGDAGCFSFYPTKNLGAIGDGGMVVTSRPEIAAACRSLREYGWNSARVATSPGWNTRLDEMQAAILSVKLAHLDADNARRRRIADFYDGTLAGLDLALPQRRAECDHVFHLYVIQTEARDALKTYLAERQIQAVVHYAPPTHMHPAYAGRVHAAGMLSSTEHVAGRVLSLPMFPELTDAEMKWVADAVHTFVDARDE